MIRRRRRRLDTVPARAGRIHLQALLRRVVDAPRRPAARTLATSTTACAAWPTMRQRRRPRRRDLATSSTPGRLGAAAARAGPRATTCSASRSSIPRARTARRRHARAPRRRDGRRARGAHRRRAAFRERYDDRRPEQRDGIASGIRGTGADHLQLRTDRDWLLDLARFVSRRRDRSTPSAGRSPRQRRRRRRPRRPSPHGGGPMMGISFLSPWRLLPAARSASPWP